MGRTLATSVQIIHSEESAWRFFRRALRLEDRASFDRLWTHVRNQTVSISMSSRPVPMEAILMAMVVGLSKEVEALRKQVEIQIRHPGESRGPVPQTTRFRVSKQPATRPAGFVEGRLSPE